MALHCLLAAFLATAKAAVVVTGATGRSGSLIYKRLQEEGIDVRAFVRNVTKAHERLGCNTCDSSEGIFIGDVTKPETLAASMDGASTLVIAAASVPICNMTTFDCHYPKGGSPEDIEWKGGRNQISAFANATRGVGSVMLISTEGITHPEDPQHNFGHVSFYKLNLEAALMGSGLGFTIIQPCGLNDRSPGDQRLVPGHDDDLPVKKPEWDGVHRGDLARLIVAAVKVPEVANGLRFDLCGSTVGEPTGDDALKDVLLAARNPWQQAMPQELV